MKMRTLTAAERYYFYHNYLIKDFHKSELKSFERIEELIQQGNYQCFGFFNDDKPLGYAYLVNSDIVSIRLLDYFAVVNSFRGKGYGSMLLADIQHNLLSNNTILLAEVENPKFALDSHNKQLRNRRIKFYEHNGFKITNVLARVLTDEYQIITLALGMELTDEIILNSLKQLYLSVFGTDFYEQNIHIRISVE